MAKLIQMTENSWLIKDNMNSALLFKNGETNYELLTENEKKVYSSISDVEKRYRKFTYDDISHTVENQKINGFNVKHKEEIEIIENSELPLYKKKGSKIEFVAGYWLLNLKNSNGWTISNCPKKITTEVNEAEGPFVNRLEALNRISILNSRK